MGFKEEYTKFSKPSPEREAFVLKTLLSLPKEQIVRSMKTITVKRPDGSTISYKVMPDYITVDGMRVPMSGNTAQAVANHFGLSLPTAQMAQDIHNNADVKVAANPLSGTGTTIDGRHYSPQDVVANQGVGYAPFAISYNQRINQQLADKGVEPGGNQIVSGFAKDIVAPPKQGRLGLYGLYDNKGKPIQGGNGETPHDTAVHTEYGTYVRLVSPEATITHPDGRTETKPIDQVYAANKYNAPSTKKPGSDNPSGKPPNPLDEINRFLDTALTGVAGRMPLYDEIIKRAADNIQIRPSIGKDSAIKDLSRNSIPGRPPAGYRPLRPGESNKAIGTAALQILNSSELGDQTPFSIGEQLYMGRTEPHYHDPPPQGEDPKKYPKPWGWHKGVTVFKAQEGTKAPDSKEPSDSSNPQSRMKMLQRVQDSGGDVLGDLSQILSEISKDV